MADAISLESLQALLTGNFSAIPRVRFVYVAGAIGAFYVALNVARIARRRWKTTALRGPPSSSFLWGVDGILFASHDTGPQCEKWAEEYGGVYEIPSVLGGRRVVLCDPKAIAHCFAREPWTYVLIPLAKIATEKFVGKGILTAVGEEHRRMRKMLAPAFSNAAIRNLSPIFYNSAYKAKGVWDHLIESNGGNSVIIEVQNWMNHISLDTIGIAGFSHDFGSLNGKPTSVAEVFHAMGKSGGETLALRILLPQMFPWLLKLPTPFSILTKKLNDTMAEVSDALIAKSKKEKEAGVLGEIEEKSAIGLLVRAESQESQSHLSREEILSQAKVLLIAGYETTSISLTWALIELSKKPDVQSKLRAELLSFGTDPSYDQLSNSLPYLDAVVHETLRMHAPVQDFLRMATVDDVIPLSKPVRTRSGELVDQISVAQGTFVSLSVPSMNRSTALWGADAKEFKPERWIEEGGIPDEANEVQGHRHLLTFIDGPRTCLGKGFAIAEFKIALSVLVKHFVFEFPDGPETKIEIVTGILERPRVVGEEDTAVPLRVRRFERDP